MPGPLLALLLALAVFTATARDPAADGDVPSAAPATADTATPAVQPDPAVDAPPAEATGDEAIPHHGAVAQADARARRAHKDLARARRNLRLTVGLVALLALWLITRLLTSSKPTEEPHHRAMAMTHEELGRLVFQAARSRDFFGFRDLFLNAHEASELMGMQDAEAYMQLRSDEQLREALDVLAHACHPGTVFGGVVPVEGGLLGIRVNEANGQHFVLAVGSVTELTGGCRLHLAAPHLASGQPGMTRGAPVVGAAPPGVSAAGWQRSPPSGGAGGPGEGPPRTR